MQEKQQSEISQSNLNSGHGLSLSQQFEHLKC